MENQTPSIDMSAVLAPITADRNETEQAIKASEAAGAAANYPKQVSDLNAKQAADEKQFMTMADQRAQAASQQFSGTPPQRQKNILSNLAPLLLLTAFGGKITKIHASAMLGATSGIVKGYTEGKEELFQESVQKYQQSYQQFKDHQEQQDKVLKVYEDAYKERLDWREKALQATLKSMDDQYQRTRNLVEDKHRLDEARARITESAQVAGVNAHFKGMANSLAERKQRDAEKKAGAKVSAISAVGDAAQKEIDKTIALIQAHPGISGLRGKYEKGKETLRTGFMGSTQSSPAHLLEQQIASLKFKVAMIERSGARPSKDTLALTADLTGGQGFGDTDQINIEKLNNLKTLISTDIKTSGSDAASEGGLMSGPNKPAGTSAQMPDGTTMTSVGNGLWRPQATDQ